MTHRSEQIASRRPRTRAAVFACVAIVLIAIDQLTKFIALHTLAGAGTRVIIPHVLSLRLIFNPGASLGFGSGQTWIITCLAIVACVALIILTVRTDSMLWTLAFAFAFAGAFGNLIDRVIYAQGFLNGKVVDFLDYGWSIGNVADIFLAIAGIGIIIMIFASVPFNHHAQHEADESDESTKTRESEISD